MVTAASTTAIAALSTEVTAIQATTYHVRHHRQADRLTCLARQTATQPTRLTCRVQRAVLVRPMSLVQQALRAQRVHHARQAPRVRRRTARFTLLPTRVVKPVQAQNM